jgi:hypothetical protein
MTLHKCNVPGSRDPGVGREKIPVRPRPDDGAPRWGLPVCPSSREGQTQQKKWETNLLGYGHAAPVMERPSKCTPVAATASSDPMMKRSLIVCPLKLAGRLITVLM